MLHAIIMAGGSGTRLWPESRRHEPKQLLKIQGDRTMIQATVDRLGDLVPLSHVLISTTESLAGKIDEQLSQLPRESILTEPCPRNTAPCIALAAIRVMRDDPDGTMVVMPADHVIEPADAFRKAIRLGESLIEQDTRRIVTYGIRPTYPAESFGYIEHDEAIAERDGKDDPAVYRVKQFREKPDAVTAKRYTDEGTFSWNSGIFLWKARTVWEAIRKYEPEMFAPLERIADAVDTPKFDEVLEREFASIEGKSIDYAVMERHPEVVVIEAPFSWDDVGSWRSLERLCKADERGNLIDATRYVAIETHGSIVRCGDPNHVVALMGVKDLIVISTPDATLVANKADEESIRQLIAELKTRGWDEFL